MKTMERSIVLVDDVLEEILIRLPVRQLLRLRCVCKSWCACIDDPIFIKKHYEFQYAMSRACEDVPIFLLNRSTRFYGFGTNHARVYLLSKQQGEDVVRNLTPALQRDSSPVVSDHSVFLDALACGGIVNGAISLESIPALQRDSSPSASDCVFLDTLSCRGVVNGVILLESQCNEPLSLWNPVTREFKGIPEWPYVQDGKFYRNCASIIGFGFDPVSNDFKVVGRVKRGDILQFEMYSLHTNSWKRLEDPPGSVTVGHPTTDGYFNGTHYWEASMLDSEELHSGHPVILSLNFNAEVFRVSYPPQHALACLPEVDFDGRIGLYKDSLAWIVRRNDDSRDPAVCNFDVWIVTKFDDDSSGVPLSWQHLLTIGSIPISYSPSLRTFQMDDEPIHLSDILSFGTFRMDGDVLVKILSDHNLVESEANLYDPSMCTFKKLGIGFGGGCYRYIESLFHISMSA